MKKNYLVKSLSILAFTSCMFASVALNTENAKAEDYVVGSNALSIAGIEVSATDFQFDGVSLSYATENKGENDATDVSAWTSGEGRLKYYTKMSTSLYEVLEAKKSENAQFTYKTGTLIIPEVLLVNGLTDLKVTTASVADVDTTEYWAKKGDEYKTMAYLCEIPRTYYTLDIAARSYLAISTDGGATYKYIYNATSDVNDCYSIYDIAKAKISANEDIDGGSLAEVEDTYCKFYVRLFDENQELIREAKYALGDKLFDDVNIFAESEEWNYEVYTPYRHIKGFYDSTGSYFAPLDWYGCDDNFKTAGGLMVCQGDMNLYAKEAPANLVEDFDVAASVSACYAPSELDANGYAASATANKLVTDKNAKWFAQVTDDAGITESGVVSMPCYIGSESARRGHFLFTSTFRDYKFFNDTNADFDNLVFRVMVKDTKGVQQKVKIGGIYGVEAKEIDTNKWVTISLSKSAVLSTSYSYTSRLSATRNNTFNVLVVTGDGTTSGIEIRKGLELYVDYVAYEKNVEISASEGFVGDEIALSTNLDEKATFAYTVIAPNGEIVSVTNGKFIPTIAGAYVVKAVTNDYKLSGVDVTVQAGEYFARQSGETTLMFEEKTMDLILQSNGEPIDGAIESETEVAILASLEGATAFDYVVTNVNQSNIVVEDGKFVPMSIGEYIVTASCELAGKVFTKTVSISVTHKSNVIEDFATADALVAMDTLTSSNTIDRNTTNTTAQYHAEYAGRYGVVSAKPFAGPNGSDGNIIPTGTSIRATADIQKMITSGVGNTGGNAAYWNRWYMDTSWDYLSIWIYIDDENPNSTLTSVDVWGRYGTANQKVNLNEWYEFKISKSVLFGSYATSFEQNFTNNYWFIQLARKVNTGEQFNTLIETTKDCRVYFDSISLEKYDGEEVFTKAYISTADDSATAVTKLKNGTKYQLQFFVGETEIAYDKLTVNRQGGNCSGWTTTDFTFTFTGTSSDKKFYVEVSYTDESGKVYRAFVGATYTAS